MGRSNMDNFFLGCPFEFKSLQPTLTQALLTRPSSLAVVHTITPKAQLMRGVS